MSVPARVKTWLREAATEEGLSLSAYARVLLVRAYREAQHAGRE